MRVCVWCEPIIILLLSCSTRFLHTYAPKLHTPSAVPLLFTAWNTILLLLLVREVHFARNYYYRRNPAVRVCAKYVFRWIPLDQVLSEVQLTHLLLTVSRPRPTLHKGHISLRCRVTFINNICALFTYTIQYEVRVSKCVSKWSPTDRTVDLYIHIIM